MCGLIDGLRADVPRQQLVDAVDGMVRDAPEHITQVCLRVEPVQLGCFHEAINGRGAFAPCVRTQT